MFYRFLVYFDGKVVRVAEEEETLSRVFIGAHFLVRNPGPVQICQCRFKIISCECEMSQTSRFWIRYAAGRRRKREQLDDVIVSDGEIGLVRLSVGAVVFGYQAQSQRLCVEFEAAGVVRAYHGHMMKTGKFHGLILYFVASLRDSVRSFCSSSAPTVPSRTIVVHVFLFMW